MKRLSIRLHRIFSVFAPATTVGRAVAAAGSPSPYGESGELLALPWEGLQLSGAA